MYKQLGLGLAVLLSIQGVVAEEKGLTGEGELGIIHTSGNTKTQNIIGKLALGYALFSWEHAAKLEALRTEGDDKLSAKRYGLNLQSNRNLSEQSYLLGTFRYEDDSFSGYDYQSTLSFGYGHKIFDTDRTGLELEAGIGIRQSKFEMANDSDREAIVRLGLNFRQKIGSHSEFTQYFLVEAGSDNTHTESGSGFKVNVMDNIALKLSLDIKHNTDVPADTEKTDTISAVTLVYGF